MRQIHSTIKVIEHRALGSSSGCNAVQSRCAVAAVVLITLSQIPYLWIMHKALSRPCVGRQLACTCLLEALNDGLHAGHVVVTARLQDR